MKAQPPPEVGENKAAVPKRWRCICHRGYARCTGFCREHPEAENV